MPPSLLIAFILLSFQSGISKPKSKFSKYFRLRSEVDVEPEHEIADLALADLMLFKALEAEDDIVVEDTLLTVLVTLVLGMFKLIAYPL